MEIPGFSIHEELGRGGSAVVYKATEVALRRVVAVKVLIHLNIDERLFQRFSQECEAMGGLSWHPHVVTVHGQGTTPEGFPYLVMEHLAEGSLADRVERESKLSWQDAMHYGVQVADALEAAHENGLLHRDVKPENVLLDRFGDAKLADFGIATVTGGIMTATGIVTATVAHAAPEVVGGARASVASDLYSLGSTLYTLCAGGPPFLRSEDESILQLIARVAVEPPPDLRSHGVPDDVTALVERLLAKEPSQRPAEAGSVIQSVQELQSRHGVTPTSTRRRPASPPVITRPLPGRGGADKLKGSTDEVATGERRPSPTPVPTGKSKRIALGTGAAVVLLVLIAAVVVPRLSGSTDDSASSDDSASDDSEGRSRPEVVATIEVGALPGGVAVGAGAVWVSNYSEGSVFRVDPSSNEVVETIQLGQAGGDIVFDDDSSSAWVISDNQAVVRIDPDTNTLTARVELTTNAIDLAVGFGSVWASGTDGAVHRINTASNTVGEPIPVASAEEGPFLADVEANNHDRSIWVSNMRTDSVARVDVDDNRVTTITVGSDPVGLGAAPSGTTWVANSGDDTVTTVGSGADVDETISVESRPWGIAVGFGAVWVANLGDGSLSRIEVSSVSVTDTITVGAEPDGIAVDEERNAVWVANSGDNTVSRIDVGS